MQFPLKDTKFSLVKAQIIIMELISKFMATKNTRFSVEQKWKNSVFLELLCK